MGKPANKEAESLTKKLDAAYITIKRLEADLKAAQRRLQVKSEEVTAVRKARKEALTLLREAAQGDSKLREMAIALLAADQLAEQQAQAQAALIASQTSIPGSEAAV